MNYNCVHDYYTDNFGDITVVVRIVKLWIIITTMTYVSEGNGRNKLSANYLKCLCRKNKNNDNSKKISCCFC